MSTRRKPGRFNAREMFTLAEVLMASPTNPMPAADARARYEATLHHLEQLAAAPEPSPLDWRTVAMAGNVLEALLAADVIDDPERVLADGFAAMRAAASRPKIRFTGDELQAVRAMVRNWGTVLEQCPHRMLLQAFRRVYADIQRRDASAIENGDLATQLNGWRASSAA